MLRSTSFNLLNRSAAAKKLSKVVLHPRRISTASGEGQGGMINFLENNPATGVLLSLGVAIPLSQTVTSPTAIDYHPKTANSKTQGQLAADREFEKERLSVYTEYRPNANFIEVEVSNRHEQQAKVLEDAMNTGLKASLISGVVSSAAVLAVNRFSPMFRAALSPAGKLGLVSMAVAGAFALGNESVIADASLNPVVLGKQRLSAHPNDDADSGFSLAGWVYDHPYKAICGASLPTVASIFYHQSRNKGIDLSRQIMKTRVFGQGFILLMLTGVMAFNTFADHQKVLENIRSPLHQQEQE
jgi:hypothetical protein